MESTTTMSSTWSQLPAELKLHIAASCDVGSFCCLRSIDRQTVRQTYPHCQSLFRHVAVFIEPESLQMLRDISEHRDLSSAVHSISFVITNGYTTIGGRQQISKQAKLRMEDLLGEHTYFVKHDSTWTSELAKTMSNFKNFDSIGLIDGQQKQDSLGWWSQDHKWTRMPGADRRNVVRGLGYTQLVEKIRAKVEDPAPYGRGWARTASYFAQDLSNFPEQWVKVLDAVAKSGKPLQKFRGYRFPGPHENISRNGFEASAPVLQAMLRWQIMSKSSKVFEHLTSLSLHLNFQRHEPKQFEGFKALFTSMRKLQCLRLNFLHTKPYYLFADMLPILTFPQLRTLVLAWNYGTHLPRDLNWDLVAFMRSHKQTLRSLVLAGQWLDVASERIPYGPEQAQRFFRCLRDELALKELRLYTPIWPGRWNKGNMRPAIAGMTERPFAYHVLHREEDRTALDVPWQFRTWEGLVSVFEGRGAAIRPALNELMETYPEWIWHWVDEKDAAEKSGEEDIDESEEEKITK